MTPTKSRAGFEAVKTGKWSLSRRILDVIDVTLYQDNAVELIKSSKKDQMEDLQKQALLCRLALGILYMYCVPCACQIRTAFSVGKHQ